MYRKKTSNLGYDEGCQGSERDKGGDSTGEGMEEGGKEEGKEGRKRDPRKERKNGGKKQDERGVGDEGQQTEILSKGSLHGGRKHQNRQNQGSTAAVGR